MRMKKDRLMPRRRFIGYKEELEQRKLGEITESFSGGTPNAGKSEYYGGRIPFIRSGEISSDLTELFITDTGLNNSSAKLVDAGDILYALYGATSGEVSISRINGAINQAILAIRPTQGDDSYMIVQWLKKQKETIISTYLQGGQGNLSGSIVKNLLITLPKNKDEQSKVGSFFKRLDLTITLQQHKLEKLQELKKAYLYEMFPTEDENIPKRRFSGFTGAWEQRKLSELATMNARIGWQNLRTSEFLDSGDYMLITGTDFSDGMVNYSTVHYVKKERYDQDKKIQVQNGSILITKDGTLGKVAYVQDLSMPATLNAGVFNVRVIDDSLVDAMYLFHFLSAPFLMNYVTRTATGGTIKHLNQNILVNFPVLLPKIEEQKLISKFLDNLSTTITLQQRKIEKLQKLKQAYLNDMFV